MKSISNRQRPIPQHFKLKQTILIRKNGFYVALVVLAAHRRQNPGQTKNPDIVSNLQPFRNDVRPELTKQPAPRSSQSSSLPRKKFQRRIYFIPTIIDWFLKICKNIALKEKFGKNVNEFSENTFLFLQTFFLNLWNFPRDGACPCKLNSISFQEQIRHPFYIPQKKKKRKHFY